MSELPRNIWRGKEMNDEGLDLVRVKKKRQMAGVDGVDSEGVRDGLSCLLGQTPGCVYGRSSI